MNGLLAHQSFNLDPRLLSDEEVDAAREYKNASGRGSAYELNEFLRRPLEDRKPDGEIFDLLDSVLGKSQTVEALTLFRATFASDFDPFVRDRTFHDPAYASTSLFEQNLGRHFVSGFSQSPIKLIISCPQKANALHLEFEHDESETEGECLLPRNGCYRIDSIRAPVTDKKSMMEEMGQNHRMYVEDFDELRIVNLTLLVR